MIVSRRLASLLFAAALTCSLYGQAPQTAPPPHPTSTPYTGDLGVFEDADRARKLHIDRVMDELRITPGKTVVDIGAGGGWFSVRAAKRTGPAGRVIAEDINPHAIDSIRERAAREHFANIEPLLGTPDDPKLPPDSTDAVLMLRVYHEIAHPPLLLAVVRAALKPGGRVGVIDHPGHGDDHGIDADVVRAEMERCGFHLVARHDFTRADQNDFFLVFEKQ